MSEGNKKINLENQIDTTALKVLQELVFDLQYYLQNLRNVIRSWEK